MRHSVPLPPSNPCTMYDKAALEALKLTELKEIAKQLKLKKIETLKKQDLIAKDLGDRPG